MAEKPINRWLRVCPCRNPQRENRVVNVSLSIEATGLLIMVVAPLLMLVWAE
jgi:hypothetical protein